MCHVLGLKKKEFEGDCDLKKIKQLFFVFQESHCRLIQPTDPAVLSELTWRQEGGWVKLFTTFFWVGR